MIQALSIAASLAPATRKEIGIKVLTQSETVSQLAQEHEVSRKFIYEQGNKAQQALEESFAASADEQEVMFYLPVTKNWLYQLILSLVLVCHCSYRGVVELFSALFDLPISVGTIHNRLKSAAASAAQINQSQNLSGIKVGLQDEIFQGSQPVLAGVDAASTYCYLLQGVEHRDEDTWGWYLLEAEKQGFKPDYTIADAAKGLRAGQSAALPETPCHGDVFHIQHQFEQVSARLSRQANGATSHRRALEEKLIKAKLARKPTRQMSSQLVHLKRREDKLVTLAEELKLLLQWMSHDVLELAGPTLAVRQELFDFIVVELQHRHCKEHPAISKLTKALDNQREQLLGFAGVLDQKLAQIAERFEVTLHQVRQVCLLHRKQPSSDAYWQQWNQLHRGLCGKFHGLMEAVGEALNNTPRASSLVENLNSRLRNYFFLRRTLGEPYLELLQFFLNHRCFMRSEKPERVGKSPKELLSGQPHSHWLELLGFNRFQRA